MFQFVVKDFQSLDKASITVDGMTLLVGETNSGKSACLRALLAACTNRFKLGQVQEGKDACTIAIKFSDSDDVLMVRRKAEGGSPVIKLGGQVFSKLSRTLPKEVREFLNLGEVTINNDKVSCTFHPQFSKPILLEYSQQRVMEIMSSSSEFKKLKLAKDVVMSERLKCQGAIATVESLINDTKEEIARDKEFIAKCHKLVELLRELVGTYRSLQDSLVSIDSLCMHLQHYQELFTRGERCRILQSLCSQVLQEVSMQADIESLISYHTFVCDGTLSFLSECLQSLSQCVSTQENASELLSCVTELQHCNESEAHWTPCKGLCSELSSALETKSILRTTLSDIDLLAMSEQRLAELRTKESELTNVVFNHICPICGNIVQSN